MEIMIFGNQRWRVLPFIRLSVLVSAPAIRIGARFASVLSATIPGALVDLH